MYSLLVYGLLYYTSSIILQVMQFFWCNWKFPFFFNIGGLSCDCINLWQHFFSNFGSSCIHFQKFGLAGEKVIIISIHLEGPSAFVIYQSYGISFVQEFVSQLFQIIYIYFSALSNNLYFSALSNNL